MDIQEIEAVLKEFVNTDSGTDSKYDVDRFSRLVEAEFLKTDMTVDRVKREHVGDILVCHAGCSDKKILLLGHMDTVFPGGTTEVRPFSRRGDMYIGPGVEDMKGGIVVMLFAVRNVLPELPEEMSLEIILNTDEETGSVYSKDLITKKAKNAIACLSFEGAKPGTLTTERKGIINFNLSVKGVSAHSGTNYEKGRNAIVEMAHKISSLSGITDIENDITFNVGKIQGGSKKNIVPDFVRAECEVRYFKPESRDAIMEKLKHITCKSIIEGTATELEIKNERPPMVMNNEVRKLFQMAQKESIAIGRDIKERKTGGGGDVSFAAMTGIPAIDGLGPEGENSHTDHEYVLINSIPYKIELVSRILRNIFNGGKLK